MSHVTGVRMILKTPSRRSDYVMPSIVAAFLLILFSLYVYSSYRYASDIPVSDEWKFLLPDALGPTVSPGWLFAQFNAHRIILTKVEAWILYRLTNWDLRIGAVVNAVLYLTIPLLFAYLANLELGWRRAWLMWVFLPVLLSTRNYENHLIVLQSAFHFAIISMILSALLLFGPERSRARTAWGTFFLIVGMYSAASGVVMAILYVTLFAIHRAICAKRSTHGKSRFRNIFIVIVTTSIALFVYSQKYFGTETQFEWGNVLHGETWLFLLVVSGQFIGSNSPATGILLGLTILALLAIPLVGQLAGIGWEAAILRDKTYMMRLALSLSALSIIFAIAMARAPSPLGYYAVAMSPRYVEFALLLGPIAVLNWLAWVPKRLHVRSVLVFGGLAAVAIPGNIGLDTHRLHRAIMKTQEGCLVRAISREVQTCEGVAYQAPLEGFMERARELDLAFYRRLDDQRSLKEQQRE